MSSGSSFPATYRPVIIEVPHFAALRNKEREIVILRSDNGESWKEHTLEATEDAVQDVLQESFDADEMNQIEDLNTNRITRILTTDFPQYFAIVSRIRQEVHAIGPQGGVVNSTVVPQVQAIFPQGALTKKIKVGLQVGKTTHYTWSNRIILRKFNIYVCCLTDVLMKTERYFMHHREQLLFQSKFILDQPVNLRLEFSL